MDPQSKLRNLLDRAEKDRIDIVELAVIKSHPNITKVVAPRKYILLGIGMTIVLTVLYMALHSGNGDECLIEMPAELSKAFRPPESCDFCENVNEVRRIAATSPEEFEELYAYSGVPVIVTDATQNWTALQVSNRDLSKDENIEHNDFLPCRSLIFGTLRAFMVRHEARLDKLIVSSFRIRPDFGHLPRR